MPPTMTADLRTRIRQAIDAQARARHQAANRLGFCAGCGTDRELHTKGCKNCTSRHYKTRQRTNPSQEVADAAPASADP